MTETAELWTWNMQTSWNIRLAPFDTQIISQKAWAQLFKASLA